MRFRLILAVNACLLGVLAVGLVVDYRYQVATQLAEKHTALREEAKTLLPAVRALRHHGIDAVQQYLDEVCDRTASEAGLSNPTIIRLKPRGGLFEALSASSPIGGGKVEVKLDAKSLEDLTRGAMEYRYRGVR